MTKITFTTIDGAAKTVDANDGESVQQAATNNNVDGITAECGGAMMCATCHTYVDEDWLDRVGSASEEELEMLEFAASEVKNTSRLSCQITVQPELDGLVLNIPEFQV